MGQVSIVITGGIWDNGKDEPYQITNEMLKDEASDAIALCREKSIFNGCKIEVIAEGG